MQGLADGGAGVVQNLAVVPACRGRGLGRALLARCLGGFRAADGVGRVELEVSDRNRPALRLYYDFGFRELRRLYRPLPETPPAPER